MYTARYQNEPKIQICIYTFLANSRMYIQNFLYKWTTLVCTHQFAFADFYSFLMAIYCLLAYLANPFHDLPALLYIDAAWTRTLFFIGF
jgi:hypothetical protein